MDNNIFYCYSYKLCLFLRAFEMKYISIGINKNTNVKYYTFEKSKRLDKLIKLWNDNKYLK